jgi:OmpA-OmpF porin, OOP family
MHLSIIKNKTKIRMPIKCLQHLCCIISLGFTAGINAQNLVTNPDFEEVEQKPYFWPKIYITKGWTNGNGGTADFFHKRASRHENGIPENYMGRQDPANGERYAGIIAFYNDGAAVPVPKSAAALSPGNVSTTAPVIQQDVSSGKYAEYLQCPLTKQLTAGSTYTISFKVSLADNSSYAVAGIGACLIPQASAIETNSYSMLTPAVVSTALIEDKTTWTEITGTMLAKGDEKYILIGAFKPALKSKKIIPEYTNDSKKAYYYIDGVSVVLTVIKPEIKEELKPVIDFSVELDGGKNFVFKSLKFETGKSNVLPESYPDLDLLANWLKDNKAVKVNIGCHTDKSGAELINQKLTEDRALAIKKYLIGKGVEAERLKTKGYGSTKLLDKNNATAKENRRIEISIAK